VGWGVYWDLYEMIPGFVAGFALTMGVSLLTPTDPEAVAELQDVRRVAGPLIG